jgi:predicted transcriptional regulator
MTNKELPLAKALNTLEKSDAIVVSFGSEWFERLKAKSFSSVIRKRIPYSTDFNWLYIHINSPIGAVCARSKIKKISIKSKNEAISMSKKIDLTNEEISAYIGNDEKVGCYELGSFEFPSEPIAAKSLAKVMVYHAPQSFFILSKKAKSLIDHIGGYKP